MTPTVWSTRYPQAALLWFETGALIEKCVPNDLRDETIDTSVPGLCFQGLQDW